jgi:hypothetical protein
MNAPSLTFDRSWCNIDLDIVFKRIIVWVWLQSYYWGTKISLIDQGLKETRFHSYIAIQLFTNDSSILQENISDPQNNPFWSVYIMQVRLTMNFSISRGLHVVIKNAREDWIKRAIFKLVLIKFVQLLFLLLS